MNWKVGIHAEMLVSRHEELQDFVFLYAVFCMLTVGNGPLGHC